MKKSLLISIFIVSGIFLNSCGEDNVSTLTQSETLLFEKQGLVDSAVVFGCYAYTVRYFVPDTLSFDSYSKIKIMFDGYANSDGSSISVFYNTISSSNNLIYEADDQTGVNKVHTFENRKPEDNAWFEVRIYINPPVCGTNEFKYTRARDLKIYGIK